MNDVVACTDKQVFMVASLAFTVGFGQILPHDAMQVQPMPSCGVCPSVTFVDSVKMNKHIFKNFSPLGSHTILVFLYQTSWQYFDKGPITGS